VYGSGRGHVAGPLGPYGEGFRAELLARGYAWGSAAHHVHLMAWVSRWLEAEGLGPGDLTAAVAERCAQARRAQGYSLLVSARALGPMLGYLGSAGVIMREGPAVPATRAQQALGSYERYLAGERGLAAATTGIYLGVAARFLGFLAAGGCQHLEMVDSTVVSRFMLAECRRRGAATAKSTVTGMRALLRFLYLDGQVAVPLAGAVPAAAGWQLAALPRTISAAEVGRLLDSCDRRSVPGCRDFAILKLLARLGLRAGEVAALDLGDFGWRRGEITVRGKGSRRDLLPLPADVGEAVAGWLAQGRPPDSGRAVFVRIRAPHGRITRHIVWHVVRGACARAGVTAAGPHQLRHASAAQMLAAGGTLAEIGQVLRHSRPKTTAIYAKVDRLALTAVARPWPEARP
jgi:integrase/recombinase XerD